MAVWPAIRKLTRNGVRGNCGTNFTEPDLNEAAEAGDASRAHKLERGGDWS